MSTGGIIAIVIGGLAILFFATSRGLINSGVSVGVGPGGVTTAKGIIAPQPSANYGGYLAASTAPGVSSALNGALTGLGGALAGWLGRPSSSPAAPAQGASASSPSLAAQPSGPFMPSGPMPPTSIGIPTSGGGTFAEDGWVIGPQISPDISFNSTAGSAFDYSGIASDNAFDPSASLESYA